MANWTLKDALTVCVVAERAVENCGWHTALTGGCLYKDGSRKDLDLVFYPHTSTPSEVNDLTENLEAAGFKIQEIFSSVIKATYNSKPVDLFVMDRVDMWDNNVHGALGSRGHKRGKHGSGY